VKAIVAISKNRVIGSEGKMPWHLPGDLRFFKRTTFGHIVVMGRRTYESIGRPLPGRENIVLTSGPAIPGVRTVRQLEEIPRSSADGREVFVIGGARLYSALLPDCEEVYLTCIDREVQGDTFLPEFEVQFPFRSVVESGPGYEILRMSRNAPAD